jgi:hypothetical protein
MPMEKDEDHALGDPSKEYCLHCARPDGSMRSYEEAVAGMTAFMVKSQGVAEEAAKAAVVEMMARLPAWQDR